MRIAGIFLIIVGAIGVIYGGITYTRRRDTLHVGPFSATVRERKTLPISPIVSGVALIAGVGLLVAGSRRRS